MTIVAYLGILACACLVKSRVRARRLLAAFQPEFSGRFHPLSGVLAAGTVWNKLRRNFSPVQSYSLLFLSGYSDHLTLLLTVNETRTYEKGLWLLTFSAATLALLANNSFGPYLASGGGVLLAVFFRPKSALRSQNISLISALLIYVGLSIAFNLLHSGFQRDASLLANDVANIAQRNGQADMAGSGRWLLWKTGLKSATERPWFGFGPDCLGQHFIDQGVTYNDRPHNEFIYFAASLGIPALFFYVTGLAAHLRNFLRVWKRLDWHVIGLFCTVGAYLISSLFGNTMFYTTPFFILFLGLSYSQLRYAAEP
jgi:O-antigen ligase